MTGTAETVSSQKFGVVMIDSQSSELPPASAEASCHFFQPNRLGSTCAAIVARGDFHATKPCRLPFCHSAHVTTVCRRADDIFARWHLVQGRRKAGAQRHGEAMLPRRRGGGRYLVECLMHQPRVV